MTALAVGKREGTESASRGASFWGSASRIIWRIRFLLLGGRIVRVNGRTIAIYSGPELPEPAQEDEETWADYGEADVAADYAKQSWN